MIREVSEPTLFSDFSNQVIRCAICLQNCDAADVNLHFCTGMGARTYDKIICFKCIE
jgi:hypothetical protein